MSKIPEGATHKIKLIGGAVGYRRKAPGGWEGYVDGDWVLLCGGMPHSYMPIQDEPEWTGEGLPSVEMVCEAKNPLSEEWLEIKVLHIEPENETCAVMELKTSKLWWSQHFRRVRTPEQIAAEKRDAAIKEMQRPVGSCNTFPFAELYDYGYRLQVEK